MHTTFQLTSLLQIYELKKKLETFILFTYSFQKQRKRHFYRGPKCLIFTNMG
jgi:hypothetical protein